MSISIGMGLPIGHTSGAGAGSAPTSEALIFRAVAKVGPASVGGGGTQTVAKPTGTVDGDIMLMQSSSSTLNNITPPAGWTQVATVDDTPGTNRTYVWWKIASSEGADYTVSTSAFNSISTGIITWYSNTAQSIVVDASATGTNASGTSHIAPSVTTTRANATLHCFYALSGSSTGTPHSGMDERWEGSGTSNFYLMTANEEAIAATGTRTATSSGSVSSAAITVAIAEDI